MTSGLKGTFTDQGAFIVIPRLGPAVDSA